MSLSITYEGRREVVKPTPTQSLSVILQHACEKFKIASSNYTLFDAKGKELDLSLSYRLSGLASGAKLEIKRRAAKPARASILVGLQLPEGGRVQANFAPSTRLWDVLLHFEQQSEGKLNLTKRVAASAGSNGDKKRKVDEPEGDSYLQPILTYMQREVATVTELYRNTLQDLGLDGNSLLRLNFRPTEGRSLEDVQAELEAGQASERQREEASKRAEEEKARRKAAEEEKLQAFREQSEKMRDSEREEFLRRAKEEAEAEAEREEERRRQEIERLVAKKEKEMEETFREMERAALEQTQVEHMRAAMRAHFAESAPRSASASTSSSSSSSSTSTSRSTPPEPQAGDRMDVEKPAQRNKPTTKLSIPDRELRVLPPTDRPFNPQEFEVPESFYEATEGDFKVAMQAIKANRMRREEEAHMKTKEMREKERLRKIPKYRKTLVKVRFPNRVEVQATFHPLEKAQAVHNVVKDALAHPDRPFYLFTTPPKERVDMTKSLLSLVMVPAAILYFSWEDNSGPAVDYLKEELVRDIADQIPAPVSFPQSQLTPASGGSASLEALGHVLGFSSSSSSSSSSSAAEPQEQPARQPPRGGARDYSNVVPKWFAAGRK